ncbi:MAG: thermonuclease family protein [bacterium]|nr:thermonuclease family protein [bacterium]
MSSLKFQVVLVIIVAFVVGFFAGSKFPKRGDELTASLLDTVKEEALRQAQGKKEGITALVTKVIDGDTIEIEGGEKVRYIGIDAPEIGGGEQKTCFAAEAAVKNGELVKGKSVRIEKDASERDPYGRLLGYVYAKTGEGEEEIFINLKLIEEGAALAASYPPDIKHEGEFSAAEEEAKKEGKGLWSICEKVENGK